VPSAANNGSVVRGPTEPVEATVDLDTEVGVVPVSPVQAIRLVTTLRSNMAATKMETQGFGFIQAS